MSSPPNHPAAPPAPLLPSLILLSHTPLPSPSGPSQSSTSFQHPEIVYHFLDDAPLALVPAASTLGSASEEKEVLVMDWDPEAIGRGEQPVVRSLSRGIGVRGVRVDWEGVVGAGAGAGAGGGGVKGEGMIVIDTVGMTAGPATQDMLGTDPAVALARFAQRNALLRETLDYRPSSGVEQQQQQQQVEEVPSPVSPDKGNDGVSVSPTSTV